MAVPAAPAGRAGQPRGAQGLTRVALLNPETLLGSELQRELERRKPLWDDLRLLSSGAGEATLSEVDGGAALVQPFAPDSLDGVDLTLVCGGWDSELPPWALAPAGSTTVLVSPAVTPPDGIPVVSGVNLEAAVPGRLLISPHPAVVVLAHLLAPLERLGLAEAIAWLVQPTTTGERAGMDELMEQARSILAFSGEMPDAVYGHQLAFNLLPARLDLDALAGQLTAVLRRPPALALQVVQGGVFHSFAASVFVRLAGEPSTDEVAAALDEQPRLRRAEHPEHLGPIAAAASDEVLVGSVEAAGHPGCYWLWAAMDNLTRGGAGNAVELAEAVLAPPAQA